MISYKVCVVVFSFLVTVVDTDAEVCRVFVLVVDTDAEVCRIFVHGAVGRGRVAIGRHQVSVGALGPVLLSS